MKDFNELCESELTTLDKQLDEISRRRLGFIGASAGAALNVALIGLLVPALVPVFIIAAPLLQLKTGLFVSMFASGKQRTLAGDVFSDLKKRDEVLIKLKAKPEDKGLVKKFDKLTSAIHTNTKRVIELMDSGAGHAGGFRANIDKEKADALRKLFVALVKEPKTNKIVTLKDVGMNK